MGLDYKNLDARTRGLMLAEIERDIGSSSLYLSDRLSRPGKAEYPSLLREAARRGTDDTLAKAVRNRMNPQDYPRGENPNPRKMPSDAHTVLAEGEFNRFYIRAVCIRAIEDDTANVIVYRAKAVARPRPESTRKIGQSISAELLLNDLRSNLGTDPAQGLPGGPESGLSVRLP